MKFFKSFLRGMNSDNRGREQQTEGWEWRQKTHVGSLQILEQKFYMLALKMKKVKKRTDKKKVNQRIKWYKRKVSKTEADDRCRCHCLAPVESFHPASWKPETPASQTRTNGVLQNRRGSQWFLLFQTWQQSTENGAVGTRNESTIEPNVTDFTGEISGQITRNKLFK